MAAHTTASGSGRVGCAGKALDERATTAEAIAAVRHTHTRYDELLMSRARYHDRHEWNEMKEVFTKSFWEGVKKTFDEALEGPPPVNTSLQTPAEGDLRASSTAETPPSPSVSSEGSDLAR